MQVREVARIRELVEDDDVVAGRGEAPCEVRADETGAAGDENAHAERLASGAMFWLTWKKLSGS